VLAQQRVLSDHFDEATMTIDCRTARSMDPCLPSSL
jgi:hypothetical protein